MNYLKKTAKSSLLDDDNEIGSMNFALATEKKNISNLFSSRIDTKLSSNLIFI